MELEKGPKSTFDYEAYIASTPLLQKAFSNSFLSSSHPGIREVDAIEDRLRSRSQGVLDKFNQIKYVIAYQDSVEQFMDDLVRWYGFPAWDLARVSADTALWTIPFYRLNSEVTEAVLFIKTEGDTYDFHLIPRIFIDGQRISGYYETNFAYSFLTFQFYDADILNHSDPNWSEWWDAHRDNLETLQPRDECHYLTCTPYEGGGGSGGSNAIAFVIPRSCPSGYIMISVVYDCDQDPPLYHQPTEPNYWSVSILSEWSPPVPVGLSGWGGNIHDIWRWRSSRRRPLGSGGGGSSSNNNNESGDENSMPDWYEQTSLCILYGPESVVGLGDEDFDPTGTEQNPLSAADRQIMNQLEAIDGLTGLNCSQEMALWDTRATLLPAILNFLDQEEWSETALAAIRAYMNQTPNPDVDSFEDFLIDYNELIQFYNELVENAPDDEGIPVVIAYILKKLAEAGVGALTDFALQIAIEYWMGGHDSWMDAWNEMEIDYWQISSSAFEAMWKNKYASVALSASSDAMNYVLSTPEEEITAEGFGTALGLGALSGFLGANASDYVGKIGQYMVKYGPQKPFNGLKALNIAPFFFNLKDFRELVIEKAWANPSWPNRGFALEELSSYGRYKNVTWLNEGGELNGPLDFLDGTLGIQLKTKAHANNWSNFKSSVKSGLNQLLLAIDNGQCLTGRLDVMMPDHLSGNFQTYQNLLYQELIENTEDYPQYAGLNIVIGSFIE